MVRRLSLVASSFVGFRSVVARRLSWVWLSSDGAWHVWLSLVTAVLLRLGKLSCVEFRYVLAVKFGRGSFSSVRVGRLSLVETRLDLLSQVTVINFLEG